MADSAGEVVQRLEGLRRGPWARAAARRAAATAAGTTSRPKPLRLAEERKLAKWLVPHWERIPGEKANQVRATLDAELDELSLWELAAETGYLPPEVVGEETRARLRRLCRSAAVREYIEDYDYLPVMYLASRVGVEGLPPFDPPPPDPSGALRFAAFLAGHADWLQDDDLDEWLLFLDDFIEEADEQDLYHDYLESGLPPDGKRRARRFARLTSGLQRFVTYLADLFGLLEPAEVPRFGVSYAYWMAKFFGYELGPEGYVRNDTIWEAGDDWARVARRSPVFKPKERSLRAAPTARTPSGKSAGANTARAAWQASIDALKQGWKDTRQFVAQLETG
jgi:hypothetical protein